MQMEIKKNLEFIEIDDRHLPSSEKFFCRVCGGHKRNSLKARSPICVDGVSKIVCLGCYTLHYQMYP